MAMRLHIYKINHHHFPTSQLIILQTDKKYETKRHAPGHLNNLSDISLNCTAEQILGSLISQLPSDLDSIFQRHTQPNGLAETI